MRKLRNAELHRKTIEQFQDHPKLPIVVVLDNVRSMNNVGSIFRTADAFLIQKIILCGITGTPPHREITKTAIGAEKSLDWEYEKSTLDALAKLKIQGYTLIALEQAVGALDLMHDTLDYSPVAFILGNEIDGVGQEVIDACDYCVEIPQLGTKHSFNVAVSFGMLLWDYAKSNRLFNTP